MLANALPVPLTIALPRLLLFRWWMRSAGMSTSSSSFSTSSSSSSAPSTSTASSSVPESARERNNRIVKELADRVVKGWTLLNSTCPTCQTALLRSKEGQVYCVGCRMPCVTEVEARHRNLVTAAAAQPPSSAPAVSSSSLLSSAAGASPSASPAMHSPPVPASRASSFAAAPSPSLSLNRPNALSNSAPPREEVATAQPNGRAGELVSLLSSPHFAQLQAELMTEANGHRADVAPSSSSTPSAASASPTRASAASVSPRVQRQVARTNSLSAKLGEKMMQGWTLMAVHCSNEACLVHTHAHDALAAAQRMFCTLD